MAATTFIVTKTTSVSGKWIPLIISESTEIKNIIIEITRINVVCNKADAACPWIATWNGLPLMKTRQRLADSIRVADDNFPCGKSVSRVHGVTGMGNGINVKDISPSMLNNIRQYFLSDLHIAFADARATVLEKGSIRKCLGRLDIVSLNSGKTGADEDERRRTTDCLPVYDKKELTPNNAISKFMCCILQNRSTACILEIFSQKHSIYLDGCCPQLDTSLFPMLYYQNDQRHSLVPLEAVENMMDFFQDIESESNLFFVDDGKQKPMVVFIHIPHHHADVGLLTFTCQMDVCYRSIDDPMLSGPPEQVECNAMLFNHPRLLSLCETICGEKDIEQMENNIHIFLQQEVSCVYKK
jgi:hypothetical protein